MQFDSGKSCTYVPMIYQRAEPNQVKRFSARVEFFPLDTIKQILSNAVDDWETYYSKTTPAA